MIRHAMVLAAGRGTRMRPLSDVVPKPALPAVQRPVIASALRLAGAAGTRPVVVNTWYLAPIMERALDELGAAVTVSREDELMGTAGGIALARDRGLLGDRGPVLVVNGDGLVNLDLEPLYRRMSTTDDLVSLAVLPHLDPLRWSRVILDHDGRIEAIRSPGDPTTGEVPFLYPGVMLVSQAALRRLPSGAGEIPDRLWQPALAEGRLGGALVSGHWREIGTPADYLEAVVARLDGSRVIHSSAEVDPAAAIGSALIGRHARVAAGAVVGDAVIAEGATVERDARVLRSVLLGDARAGPGESVVDEFRAVRS